MNENANKRKIKDELMRRQTQISGSKRNQKKQEQTSMTLSMTDSEGKKNQDFLNVTSSNRKATLAARKGSVFASRKRSNTIRYKHEKERDDSMNKD